MKLGSVQCIQQIVWRLRRSKARLAPRFRSHFRAISPAWPCFVSVVLEQTRRFDSVVLACVQSCYGVVLSQFDGASLPSHREEALRGGLIAEAEGNAREDRAHF